MAPYFHGRDQALAWSPAMSVMPAAQQEEDSACLHPRPLEPGASKCNDEVTAWLRRKRMDERAFLLRRAEIRACLTA